MNGANRIETQRDPVSMRAAPEFLAWRPEWELGIASMDADHRTLVEQLNRIARPLMLSSADDDAATRARLYLGLTRGLRNLGATTRIHFDREEALMRIADYPWIGEHKREHAMLHAEFTEFLRENSGMRIRKLKLSALESLKGWFLGHLLDMDRHLALYLRKIGFVEPH
jgi:hemerythrin